MKKITSRQITIKLLKTSDKVLKEARGKRQLTHRETKIQMTDFSLEIMQARRQRSNIFKVLKEKTVNLQFYI